MTEDGNFFRIAAKAVNIVVNPFNGLPLIEQASVFGYPRGAGKSKNVDSIVDCDEDHILGGRDVLALIKFRVGVTKSES